jgi:hypothetical protein
VPKENIDKDMDLRRRCFPAFYDGTLNMLLIDKMMRDGSFDYYNKPVDGSFEADKQKAKCFFKENMRLFSDHITVEKKLYVIVKTWQKVNFQTEDQRQIIGRVTE